MTEERRKQIKAHAEDCVAIADAVYQEALKKEWSADLACTLAAAAIVGMGSIDAADTIDRRLSLIEDSIDSIMNHGIGQGT